MVLGEGDAPWAGIFKAAESGGGVEYYLIEQEGSRYPSLKRPNDVLPLIRS